MPGNAKIITYKTLDKRQKKKDKIEKTVRQPVWPVYSIVISIYFVV
jgi:hypothetical protein